MPDHAPRSVQRVCDVAVIGGSAAGLAAALQLGRQRRSVIVVDAGEPRNAPAVHMHSYLGHEGASPSAFTRVGREEVRSYGVEVLDGRAVDVVRAHDGFVVVLTGGHSIRSRRVLAATGLVDELPEIDGLVEQWGRAVIHCPFCHGYEVRDQRIVQIITHPMGLHTAALFRQLSDRFTLVVHDGVDSDHPELATLRDAGVRVVHERVERVVTGAVGRLETVQLAGGDHLGADAVVVGTRFHPRVEALRSLGVGVVAHPTGLGEIIQTDSMGETTVPGLYAAGNVTDPSHQVLHAAANGSWVGGMVSVSLAHEDLGATTRTSANQTDWDERYSGEPLWSGNPNGTLVHEVSGLAPGTALDVGAGEGGDAIWLAQQGWQVTASDISQRVVEQIESIASARNLTVVGLHADANARAPFPKASFDLVTAHYASIPRTPDGRGIDNMLAAVTVGGTLLVVGHDQEPMREPIDTSQRSRGFDPDAYVRVDDVAAVLAGSPDWHVEIHGTRPRPPGHTSASHHVDDVVVRARRIR
jgi:thioredoxin reductase/SAM-dependent methyltransferase